MGNNSPGSIWETWWYFTSSLENTLLAAAVMAKQIPPTSPERVWGWSQTVHLLGVQQQGSNGWPGGAKPTSWGGHVSTVQHYSGTIFSATLTFSFPLWGISLWAASVNKGKALEQDSHRTCTVSHITEIKKRTQQSLRDSHIFVEFS